MKFKINFYYKVNKHGCVETLAHVKVDIINIKTDPPTIESQLLIGLSKQNAMDVHEIGTGQLVALERAIHDLTGAQQDQIVNSYGQKFPQENKLIYDVDTIIKADIELLELMLYLSTNVSPVGDIKVINISDEIDGVAITCNYNNTGLHIYSTGRMFIHNSDGTVTPPHNHNHINSILETVLLAKI